MPESSADPFVVTEREERLYKLILAAARAGRIELRTGTLRHERAAFLCVVVEGVRYPLGSLLRAEDIGHIRDADLAPARVRSAAKEGT